MSDEFDSYREARSKQLDPKDYVPWEWQGVVCLCPSYSGSHGFNEDGSPAPCKVCGKQQRWQVITRCKGCNKSYWHWFQHHARRAGQLKCWTCLVEEYGQESGDFPPSFTAKPIPSLEAMLADDDPFGDWEL